MNHDYFKPHFTPESTGGYDALPKTNCKHGDAECGWCSSVEKKWRKKFDHDGPCTPSVAEMERMLDAWGWS